MSWHRGELWLDDALWPVDVVALPSPPPPADDVPPGLVDSLRRREDWRQRRRRRKARATAAALSPALVLALAGLRSAERASGGVSLEDAPTVTLHLGTSERVDSPGRAVRAKPKARPHRPAKPRTGAREVDWHHAESLGLPYAGRLVDGTQLPQRGPNWVTWDPVTNRVPDEPRRLYGNQRTIRTVLSVAAAYRAANPGAPKIVVGDISREGGGPMLDEHVSHQNGLDVDVYYPRRDRRLSEPTEPGQIDRRLAQDLLDRFVAAGAQMVFVGFSTGLHGPPGVVIPYPNHDNHMHVRFPPPAR
jgi:hypothetical protein